MGLKQAFQDNADFSNLTKYPIYIDQVNQKTFFEMDEKGTTAAAVTSVTTKSKSINSNKKIPIVMICDRPYLIFLTKYCPEIKKTLILFCAKIENPCYNTNY